jgi:nucleoside-diphosphate-sugar epimerase
LAAVVDWGTHPREEVLAVNLGGTENVIRACVEEGVGALVFTSSEDAIYTGKPIRNGTEDLPYPESFPNAYCESKAEAEKKVIAANGAALRTVVLRPAGIYGEGDPYHLPPLIEMARKGFYARIGDGSAECLHVYVGNVAQAHVAAAGALSNGKANAAAKVYFVTDSPPCNFFGFLDRIVVRAGYRIHPKSLWFPFWLMYLLGCMTELAAFLLRPFVRITPKLSRFAVKYTCTDFTFSGERARREIGYLPRYSEAEALERTAAFFRNC